MAKITLTLCDVKPCNLTADRDFQVNGQTVHVCGEGCYVKYWSREYQVWKQDPYALQANHTPDDRYSDPVLQLVTSTK